MKKILVLVLSNLKHDARVRRQVSALQDKYDVTVACFDGDTSDKYKLSRFKPTNLTLFRKALASVFLILKAHSLAYKTLHNYANLIEEFRGEKFDLIIANDVETLPLAFNFPGSPKVVFDAHEYAPRHFEDKLMWRIFFQAFNTWLCEKYIPLTAGMITVGKGLAMEYEKHFHVRPEVITNANYYMDLDPLPVIENSIRLVHHGIATPSRKLELMVDMMKLLDKRFTLDMYLMVPGFASRTTRQYIDNLRNLAASDPRIRILPPVAGDKVVSTVHQYDVGVFLIPPINFNYKNTLPNKLFDFIQGRLAIAIGPTPEMAEIVNHYKTGVVSKEFSAESLATELNKLTQSEVETFKKNSGVAAKQLNAEINAVKIQAIVASVLT